MQAYRLWAAICTYYLQLVDIGYLKKTANRNCRYIGGMLKLHLTNQALMCVGATDTRK